MFLLKEEIISAKCCAHILTTHHFITISMMFIDVGDSIFVTDKGDLGL